MKPCTTATAKGPATPAPAIKNSSSTKQSTVTKVRADIDFLKDRIAQLKSHQQPNRAVLHTYLAMLSRREAALLLLLPQEPGAPLPAPPFTES